MDLMDNEMSVADTRANLTDVLNAVRFQRRVITVTSRSKPVGAIVPAELGVLIGKIGVEEAERLLTERLVETRVQNDG